MAYLDENENKESLELQIDRLADYIVRYVPGEPSEPQGVVDTAIRIMSKYYPASNNAIGKLKDVL